MAHRRVLKRLRSIGARVRRLPAYIAVPLALIVLTGAVVGSIFGYRAYNYVQHDNEFCLSCHLMEEPYERFARSAHRGLGCKACHQPTPVARGNLAFAQVLEQPESIAVHAEVPNERCIECHVEGDPAEWRQIANSVGHRVHLASDDPQLQGITCVQCHSSSVHEFTATSKTCSQSECHENTTVQLGGMAQLTIHCVACHDFSRPVRSDLPRDSLRLTLRPEREQCLTCHQMGILVGNLPDDEPHGGACGACHNPHEQKTPAEAVQSCAGSECHARADTLTPLHRGLETAVLANCTNCHRAHSFRLVNAQCTSCHSDIFMRESSRSWTSGSEADAATVLSRARQLPAQDPDVRFAHARHRELACTTCHDSTNRHGQVKLTSIRQCRECHHEGANAERCIACHSQTTLVNLLLSRDQPFRISAGARSIQRSIRFVHADHSMVTCLQCHTEPINRSASQVDCLSCHREHHDPNVNCRSCHVVQKEVHDARVHLGCAGSGCHSINPIAGVPRTREFCLTCHQDMALHRPGGNCATCHAMPTPRSSARAPR